MALAVGSQMAPRTRRGWPGASSYRKRPIGETTERSDCAICSTKETPLPTAATQTPAMMQTQSGAKIGRKKKTESQPEAESQKKNYNEERSGANANLSTRSTHSKSVTKRKRKMSDVGVVNSDHTEENGVAAPKALSSRKDVASVQIQRCGFVKWEVHGLVAAGTSSKTNRVAFARSNGTIEVRSTKASLPVVGFLPSRNLEVTSLAFHQGRLLVGSLDGIVAVFDYESRLLIETVDPAGGAVWCLSTSPKGANVAVGCEDGTVRLLSIGEDGRYDVRRLDKGMTRVTIITWDAKGDTVVVGDGNGGLRRIKAATGTSVASAQISSKKGSVSIWCSVICDDVVITGDSRGVVTVWNAEMLLAEKELWVEGLEGDVTALCVLEDVVFVGAANGAIGIVERTDEGGWVAHRGRRVHLNDIRAIVRLGQKPKVASVGDDSVIAVQTLNRFRSERPPRRLYPTSAPATMPLVQIQSGAALALYDDRVELWRLPATKFPSAKPLQLLRIRPGDLGGTLTVSAMSPGLRHVVTSGSIRMASFQVELGNGTVEAKPLCDSLPASRWASFLDERFLACISLIGDCIRVMDVVTGATRASWDIKDSPQDSAGGKSEHFRTLFARNDGVIAATDSRGQISLYHVHEERPRRTIRLPDHMKRNTLLSLHPTKDLLACASDSTVTIVSFADGGMKILSTSDMPKRAKSCVAGLSYAANCKKWAIFGRDFALLVNEELKETAVATERKRKRQRTNDQQTRTEKRPLRHQTQPGVTIVPMKTATHVLGFAEACSSGAVALVERAWDLVLQTLPPSLPRKMFAT